MNSFQLVHLEDEVMTLPTNTRIEVQGDFRAYLRVENRLDLLVKAVGSIPEFWRVLTIVENSPERITEKLSSPRTAKILEPSFRLAGDDPPSITVFYPPVPLTFTQSHNWWFANAKKKGAQFVIWIHNDAASVDGGHLRLLDFVRRITAAGRKWGTVFTSYDALAAVNLAAIEDVGGYDTAFPKYGCDCDLYHRFTLAGWECINTGIVTNHVGSQTILSDTKLRFVNGIIHPHSMDYYRNKWGGNPGEEKFAAPFNRPDLFPNLKPVGVW
jgi:hypothetical protein